MYPRSAVKKTRSLRRENNATIACANSARIAIAFDGVAVRANQLIDRTLILTVVHWQVMTIHRVLQIAHSMTFDGIGNDCDRPPGGLQHAGALLTGGQQ